MGRLLQNPITWVSIDSSVLQSAAYVTQRRCLYLKFQSGEIYRYLDVPVQQYREFLAAESKGAFFGKHIRDQFRYERLPRSRHAGG